MCILVDYRLLRSKHDSCCGDDCNCDRLLARPARSANNGLYALDVRFGAFSRNIFELLTPFTHTTRLTITEDPGEEFIVRGHNTGFDSDDDEIVFYNDVTKVHVVPERENFTIQVVTPEFLVEMDFANADEVREALGLFEAKKVLEIDFDAQNSVRIMPSSLEPAEARSAECR